MMRVRSMLRRVVPLVPALLVGVALCALDPTRTSAPKLSHIQDRSHKTETHCGSKKEVIKAEGERTHYELLAESDADIHLGCLGKPGYYTVVLFSARWCEPCGPIWKEILTSVSAYANV